MYICTYVQGVQFIGASDFVYVCMCVCFLYVSLCPPFLSASSSFIHHSMNYYLCVGLWIETFFHGSCF